MNCKFRWEFSAASLEFQISENTLIVDQSCLGNTSPGSFLGIDPALILTLCAGTGLSPEDPRLSSLIEFIRSAEGPGGLWSYAPAPGAERWIALEIRTALRDIESGGSWIGGQPSTPFSPYPRQRRRY